MWIFKHKKKFDGSFERYKPLLIGNSDNQQSNIDYGETFSPIVKPIIIRMVLSITLSKSRCLHHLHVKNAFLHGNLDETMYMYQPPRFRDSQHPEQVYILKKSLYGLKQAPRVWYQRFIDYVTILGFYHIISWLCYHIGFLSHHLWSFFIHLSSQYWLCLYPSICGWYNSHYFFWFSLKCLHIHTCALIFTREMSI